MPLDGALERIVGRAEMRALMSGYREQLERAGREAQRLEPYYREMVLRAAAQDVGMNRWLEAERRS